jgi:hypothetical protein
MASKDDLETLEILKAELDFIEDGGYGRSVRTPWKPTTTLLDSPTCLNFSDPQRTHPCNECLLMKLVPTSHQSESVPCHHIPLNAAGDTLSTLQQAGEREPEEVVKDWLVTTIKRLEEEQPETE